MRDGGNEHQRKIESTRMIKQRNGQKKQKIRERERKQEVDRERERECTETLHLPVS